MVRGAYPTDYRNLENKMTLYNDIYCVIEKIPASFWGVVTGSFFSMGGVVLSNRANDRRLRQQLLHDRESKNHEREMSLRKDIYLTAVEAIATGIYSLGSFANLNIPDEKITSAFTEKSPSITKIHVIAQKDTSKAVVKLVSELGAAYLRLIARRIPLFAEQKRINFHKEQLDIYRLEQNRMLELMKQYNLSGDYDHRKWDILEKNYNFEGERIDATIKEHDSLAYGMYLKQLNLMTECIAETTELSPLIVPVLTAIRTELEMPLDEISLAELIEESIEHQKSAVEEFLRQAHSSVAQPNPQ